MLSVTAIASLVCQPQSKYQRGGRLRPFRRWEWHEEVKQVPELTQ